MRDVTVFIARSLLDYIQYTPHKLNSAGKEDFGVCLTTGQLKCDIFLKKCKNSICSSKLFKKQKVFACSSLKRGFISHFASCCQDLDTISGFLEV